MKTGHWVLAVCILVGMVFGITWVKIHDSRSDEGRPAKERPGAGLRLNFPFPKYPPYGGKVLCEVNKEGECDFWFTNPNNKEVKVGLLRKSCKCANIRLHIVGLESPTDYVASSVGLAGITLDPFGGVLNKIVPRLTEGALLTWQEDWGRLQRSQSGDGVELTEEPGSSTTVPAGAIGKVHLNWKTERTGDQGQLLTLWTDHRSNPISTLLEAQAAIMPPLQGLGVYDVGVLEERQLPFTKDVYCFSQTRPSVPVKVKVMHDNRDENADPVEVGPVVPAGPEEFASLRERYPQALGAAVIRSGYKATVTLRRTSEDGTPFEQGAFYRRVEFYSDAEGVEPIETALSGQVLAVVTVGEPDSGGHVLFGSFHRSEGKVKKILLQSDVPKLDLEVDLDPKHVPEFLDVPKLDLLEETPSGHRSWRLELRVLPNKALGRFPNAEDPAYRDSAIYIKTKGEPTRPMIRVPLSGVANDD
jgi:hypothetical protein